MAAIATLITSGASAIGKASLDASLQDDLPEESRPRRSGDRSPPCSWRGCWAARWA
ncbi:hypothetical protein I552_1864 [Mycobacterium xenopi 3993]|nr:hypothetical protein I552_1864 [Mycobacterium xenopi 3993]